MVDCAIQTQLHFHGLVKSLRNDVLCNRDAIAVWLKTDYVMNCTISMQLHSHGLVKNLRRDDLRKRNATTFPQSR